MNVIKATFRIFFSLINWQIFVGSHFFEIALNKPNALAAFNINSWKDNHLNLPL
jgi:hypothetical protein